MQHYIICVRMFLKLLQRFCCLVTFTKVMLIYLNVWQLFSYESFVLIMRSRWCKNQWTPAFITISIKISVGNVGDLYYACIIVFTGNILFKVLLSIL